jgi:hypothetical protein
MLWAFIGCLTTSVFEGRREEGNGGREEKWRREVTHRAGVPRESVRLSGQGMGRASAGKEGPSENQERGEWRKIPPLTAMRRAHLALPPNAPRT